MDFLKGEISNSIQELLEKTRCIKARAFAEEFIKVLEVSTKTLIDIIFPLEKN